MANNFKIAKSVDQDIYLNLPMANRHGLIAGATGTGKTVTLKVMAEQFSKQVFLYSWQMLKVILQVSLSRW